MGCRYRYYITIICIRLLFGCLWLKKPHVNVTLNELFFPDGPKDLIRKLLVVDPAQRLTVNEALRHEFFQVTVWVSSLSKYQNYYCQLNT